MRGTISNLFFDTNNKIINICGYVEEHLEEMKIEFQENMNDLEGLHFINSIEVQVIWNGNNFTGIIDLKLFEKEFTQNREWGIYLVFKNKAKQFILDNAFNDFEYLSQDSTLKCMFKLKARKNLLLEIRNNITANITEYKEENGFLTLKFDINNLESFKNINKASIVFKNRLTREIFTYDKILERKIEEYGIENTIKIDYREVLSNFELYNDFVIDIFIKYELNHERIIEIPLGVYEKLETDYILIGDNIQYKMKFFCNYKKNLSILVKKKNINVEVYEIDQKDDKLLKLKGRIVDIIDNYKVISLVIEPKMKFNNIIKKNFIIYNELESNGNEFECSLDLTKILKDVHKSDKQCFEMKLQIENITNKHTENYNINCNKIKNNKFVFQYLDEDTQIIPVVNKDDSLNLKIKKRIKKNSNMSINLNILGSCLSRLPFTSTDFFNPMYKNRYKIMDTYFHTSIVSLVSNPVENTEKIIDKYFNSINDVYKDYIRKDFNKSFFDNLLKNKPDFLIIDFYQDACRDFILLDNDVVISGNVVVKKSSYLKSLEKSGRIISHNEASEFLEYWNICLDIFVEKLVKYIPEERIILNNVRAVNEYIDENGDVKEFKTTKNYVKRSNYFYDYMNMKFKYKLPNINVIDVNDFKYISCYNHPEKASPNHYESEYYKEFMNQLNEIVLSTLIKDNKLIK